MEKQFSGHGYVFDAEDDRSEESIYIDHTPGRKQVCLFEMKGGEMAVLAYFKDDEKAAKALAWVDRLVGGAKVRR